MSNWTRRHLIGSATALSALTLSCKSRGGAQGTTKPNLRIEGSKPLIHVCDLYRPHDDPDDHWDLATIFAMTCRGDLDLLGVLTDNPQNMRARYKDGQNPDLAAIAQLNYLTDRAVPIAAGTIWPTTPGEKVREDNLPKDLKGVNMLLDLLERSAQRAAISVVGSCQDVAIAGKKEPRLFSEKCAAIYLSAGVGSQDPRKQTHGDSAKWPWEVEWNVSLNRGAYATIFELPCPVFWLPCFDDFSDFSATGEHGSAWKFRQKEILPHLRSGAQAYFSYALSKESGANWLSYLFDSESKSEVQKYFDETREMYSTAAFFHAAGETVTFDGEIVSQKTAAGNAVYEFVPVDVRCDEKGITQWQAAKNSTDRYIFRIRDKKRYDGAMVKALKSVLLALP